MLEIFEVKTSQQTVASNLIFTSFLVLSTFTYVIIESLFHLVGAFDLTSKLLFQTVRLSVRVYICKSHFSVS